MVLLWIRRVSCHTAGYGRARNFCSGRPAEGISIFRIINSLAFGIASVRRTPLPAFPGMSSPDRPPIPVHYQSDLPRHPWRGIGRIPAVRPCSRRRPIQPGALLRSGSHTPEGRLRKAGYRVVFFQLCTTYLAPALVRKFFGRNSDTFRL